MARWSWQYVRNLFAVLAVAKGRPLPISFIEELSNGATLDELDQRAERWLWRRPEEVSLAHPRLAAVFESVLPSLGVNIRSVEDRLVSECEQAWHVKGRNEFTRSPSNLTSHPLSGSSTPAVYFGSHFSQSLAKASTFSMVTGIRSALTKLDGGFL
jgi:hypothetical protein